MKELVLCNLHDKSTIIITIIIVDNRLDNIVNNIVDSKSETHYVKYTARKIDDNILMNSSR